MKKPISAYLLVLFLLMAFRCEDHYPREVTKDCIDPSKIDEDAACPMIYDPVCGCDGKTYGNECIAMNSGLKKWEPGECE